MGTVHVLAGPWCSGWWTPLCRLRLVAGMPCYADVACCHRQDKGSGPILSWRPLRSLLGPLSNGVGGHIVKSGGTLDDLPEKVG